MRECEARDGKIYLVKGAEAGGDLPPVHYGCRCRIEPDRPKTPSDDLIVFITNYEDYHEMPYRGLDNQNRTVGYGHVILDEDYYDNGISEEEALTLLKNDIQIVAAQYLDDFLQKNDVVLTQQQYDALLSFTFNTGPDWLTEYYELRDIIKGENITYEDMYDEFMTWINVNGKPALGLYRRRLDELDIFFNGDYTRKFPDKPDWF